MGDNDMEILSTGEKIKRARIYKGLTLKELCEDKISVSKMSCIENNKIKADDWILDFVSKKLELDLAYLKKDVDEQLKENLGYLNKYNKSYEEDLKVIIEYAEKYNNYNRAFESMHKLFRYYFENNMSKPLQDIQCKYYDLYEKAFNDENEIIYYMDLALYLYANNEVIQCINYYENVKLLILKKEELSDEDKENLATIFYNQSVCCINLKDYDKAFEIGQGLREYIDLVENNFRKANMYQVLAMLSILGNTGDFKVYEEKSYFYHGDDNLEKARVMNNYAEAFFERGEKEKALSYVNEALKICPRDNRQTLVHFLLEVTENLIDNKYFDKAESVCDEALNESISLNNIRFIERSYYYRALICMKKENEYFAEMYMNLSLDSLVKFGTKKDIYGRYIELGTMYNKMGNVREALKYFGLSMSIEKKL